MNPIFSSGESKGDFGSRFKQLCLLLKTILPVIWLSRTQDSLNFLGQQDYAETALVPEMPYSGENHCQAQLICRGNYFVITHRPARLDDGPGPRLSHSFKAVREGKEGI